MNKFLILAAIIATAFARPGDLLEGHDGRVSVSHNTIGTYKYNVELRDSSRSEERFADGTVVGEYSIIDANGIPQTYKYTAGEGGFRILDGPLPVAPLPVAETPEVLAARAAFPVSVVPVASSSVVPSASSGLLLPVEDTVEVKAAKATFFTTHHDTGAH